jgi:hypothetical protein
MSELTDADLEAMEKRCEAVHTEAVRENSPWNPWFMGQAEILATDLSALIAALREARALIAAEVEEVGWLKEIAIRAGYDLDARAVCRKTGFQNCTQCPRLECCDNQSRFSKYEIAMGERRKSAEVERVKRLEKVAEAAKVIRDYESFECTEGKIGADLDAALAELDAGEGSC